MNLRYFFYATTDRQLDPEYNTEAVEDNNDIPISSRTLVENAAGTDGPAQENVMDVARGEDDSHVDQAMAGWFKVDGSGGGDHRADGAEEDEDSETEPDSDYDEAQFEGDPDEWVEVDESMVPGTNATSTSVSFKKLVLPGADGRLLINIIDYQRR